MIFNRRSLFSIIVLVLCMILIYINQPSFMFDKDGHIKEFGSGEHKSVYSLGVVASVISIASFYTFSLIDLMYN